MKLCKVNYENSRKKSLIHKLTWHKNVALAIHNSDTLPVIIWLVHTYEYLRLCFLDLKKLNSSQSYRKKIKLNLQIKNL